MSSFRRHSIVIGVIKDESTDNILISRRQPGSHLEGLWELPGGKAVGEETQSATLQRELYEETGIRVQRARHFISYDYDYPDRRISLHAWQVMDWQGIPSAREGQDIRWVARPDLGRYTFPAANQRLLRLIGLPHLYFITPDLETYDKRFIERISLLISRGLELVQFRGPRTRVNDHRRIARELLPICNTYGCRFIYNGDPDTALEIGAHGVHLNSHRLMQLGEKRPGLIYAASCHDSDELGKAVEHGVDFCVLSPVNFSRSHGVKRVLGWDTFGSLVSGSPLPVFALGGVKPGELKTALHAGGYGVAMISGLWDADDPVSILDAIKHGTD